VQRRLRDVRVEVTAGAQAGRFTFTNAEGNFSFPEPFTDSEFTLHASKAGYQDLERTLIVRNSTMNLGFVMASVTTLDISGEYVVTFEAASTCTNLPYTARSRTYDATIARRASSSDNSSVEVRLRGGSFFQGRDGTADNFWMNVADDFVRFYLDAEFGPGYVSENLGGSTYLTLTGAGSGPLTAGFRTAALPFEGDFDVCDVPPGANQAPCYYVKDPNKPRAVCHSTDHRMTLIRRE
jgi:hypothetical protein